MSQVYADPESEADPFALPNIETFYVEFYGERPATDDVDGEYLKVGWYWWFCFPGCLPDSDPVGPFDTEEAAIKDARQYY